MNKKIYTNDQLIDKLKKEGIIIEPKKGYYMILSVGT